MILSNQVQCTVCGDKPYSAHRHDFTSCECGAVSVDGGMDYLRRCGDPSDYSELSIDMPDPIVKECTKAIDEARESGRNPLGILCSVMRVLRDNGYDVGGGYNAR